MAGRSIWQDSLSPKMLFQGWQIHGTGRIHLPTWHKLCFGTGRSMGLAEFTCQHDWVCVSGLADPWDWQNSPANMTQIVFQGLQIHGNCRIHLPTWQSLCFRAGRSMGLAEFTCQHDINCVSGLADLWCLQNSPANMTEFVFQDWQIHETGRIHLPTWHRLCFRVCRSTGIAEFTCQHDIDDVSGLADPWDWQNSPANYPVFSTFQSSSPHTR